MPLGTGVSNTWLEFRCPLTVLHTELGSKACPGVKSPTFRLFVL
jgi:hypothetical protein